MNPSLEENAGLSWRIDSANPQIVFTVRRMLFSEFWFLNHNPIAITMSNLP
jgi:hypothetical protein